MPAPRRKGRSNDRPGPRVAVTDYFRKGGAHLVRLYAGEIIMGKITEDNVPAKLKARVHQYLVDAATSSSVISLAVI